MLSPGLLTYWTREALAAARAGNDDATGDICGQITDRTDALDLIAVCRVVADTALRALLAMQEPPDELAGEAWVLEDPPTEAPDRLFAARLVTAYANRDHDTVTALVAAAANASRDERAESLWSLVNYAAGLDAQAAQYRLDTEGTTCDD
ncbi:hypothetical protein ACFY0G_17345 [Streptomyces sp. NPDC001552]|uniref:hypothetical protein n=1 Tax=Streptomyces sp. NPDC001552 TaxID=3364587 RepID=UPI0036A4593D